MGAFEAEFRSGTGKGTGSHEKVVRVLQVAWLLQSGEYTVDQLADRFGVSRRTVYRDLRLVDEARLPLVSQHQGKGYRVISPRSWPGGQLASPGRT